MSGVFATCESIINSSVVTQEKSRDIDRFRFEVERCQKRYGVIIKANHLRVEAQIADELIRWAYNSPIGEAIRRVIVQALNEHLGA